LLSVIPWLGPKTVNAASIASAAATCVIARAGVLALDGPIRVGGTHRRCEACQSPLTSTAS
jgi:hypothetical protein